MSKLLGQDGIAHNYFQVCLQVALACKRVGRDPSEVIVVAISKTVGAPEIQAAIQAGIHSFGESRTAALKEKQFAFPQEDWHFIGSIQTNKIKDFVGKVALVHSVASDRVLLAIAKRAQVLGLTQKLLFEINVSGEDSKDGATPQQLEQLLSLAADLKGVEVCGLMTMAPLADEQTIRAAFSGLRQLRDIYSRAYGDAENILLTHLSMGMSNDFVVAVEEGATIVRVGRSIWL